VKIVTVLKTSNDYKKEYVDLLYNQCEKYAPNADFICISDDTSVPGYMKMEHDWPRWWPKMEIFKIQGPVLYLDLDTIIVADLTDIFSEASRHEFVGIRDFYKDHRMQRTLGSGIMFWSGDMRYLYEEFLKDPQKNMDECNTSRWWGDQGFIEKTIKNKTVYWQDITPKKIVSWKVHCKAGIPKEAHIIAFHGTPKPWEIKL
jgi:lipopolysaccharide biosynthesis glycosyltransferase